jgi:hypothetical protein
MGVPGPDDTCGGHAAPSSASGHVAPSSASGHGIPGTYTCGHPVAVTYPDPHTHPASNPILYTDIDAHTVSDGDDHANGHALAHGEPDRPAWHS